MNPENTTGGYGSTIIHGKNGHSFKTPPLTNLLQIFQILAILSFAFAWWTKRESASDVVNTTQTMMIDEQGRRLDIMDKRLSEIESVARTNQNDLHDLMTKFRIMVEVVDGNKSKPELHK